MNNEPDKSAKNQEQAPTESSSKLEAAIEKIKHPPAIDDVMRELSPEELMGPAVVPQTIHEPSDLRDDMKA